MDYIALTDSIFVKLAPKRQEEFLMRKLPYPEPESWGTFIVLMVAGVLLLWIFVGIILIIIALFNIPNQNVPDKEEIDRKNYLLICQIRDNKETSFGF